MPEMSSRRFPGEDLGDASSAIREDGERFNDAFAARRVWEYHWVYSFQPLS